MNMLRWAKVGPDKNPKPMQHKYDDHGPDALRYFFNHYFVLGHGSHLRDAYRLEPSRRRDGTKFKLYQNFTSKESEFSMSSKVF